MNNTKRVLKENEIFLSGKGLLPKSYRLMGGSYEEGVMPYSNSTGDNDKSKDSVKDYNKENNKKALLKMSPMVGAVILIIGVSFYVTGKN